MKTLKKTEYVYIFIHKIRIIQYKYLIHPKTVYVMNYDL